MKILHTSDWHLGRGLHGHLLYDAQATAVNFIVDQAIEQKVTAVIIAGDVYDRQIPPTESIKLLNLALTRLHDAGISTIITAGNHDGAERISANSNLYLSSVRIAGDLSDISNPVVLEDEHGPLLVYPLTYLHPEVAASGLAEAGEAPLQKSHAAVMTKALSIVKADLKQREEQLGKSLRSVVIAHAFVGSAGGESKREEHQDLLIEGGQTVSESERDLSIGGIQIVPADVFEGVSYVALGHLHGAQRVNAKKAKDLQLRYSGSLLRYSMSERNHKKSFVIIDFDGSTKLTDEQITTVPIPQPRGMARIVGTIDELLSGTFAANKNDFVEVIVTDRIYPDNMYNRVNDYFPQMLNLVYRPGGGKSEEGTKHEPIDVRNVDPMNVMGSFFERSIGEALDDEATKVLRKIFEEVRDEIKVAK